MTDPAITPARYLPIGPIRDRLIARNAMESYGDMAERWAKETGRSQRSLLRLLHRIVGQEKHLVNETNADEICMYVLRTSGVAVYGVEGWADSRKWSQPDRAADVQGEVTDRAKGSS